MKRSRCPKRAIEKLTPFVEGVSTERIPGGRIRVTVDDCPELTMEKRPIKALAFLADLIRRTADRVATRDAVRWTGGIPMSGLAGWERQALEWIQEDDR